MQWSLWWWVVPAVLVFWAIGAHNRLTRLRAAVMQAFAALDAALRPWIALVPPASDAAVAPAAAAAPDAALPAVSPDTDAATVPAEQPLFDEAGWASLRAAALQLSSCLDVARQRSQRRADIAALAAARAVLRDAWQRLLAEAPRPSGPPPIQIQWEQRDTEVQLAADRFNQAVSAYNAALRQFPASLLAWILRLRRAQGL